MNENGKQDHKNGGTNDPYAYAKAFNIHEKMLWIESSLGEIDARDGFKGKYADRDKLLNDVKILFERAGVKHYMEEFTRENELDPKSLVLMSKPEDKVSKVLIRYTHTYVNVQNPQEKLVFRGMSGGQGDQIGQSIGASNSYAKRQEYQNRFNIILKGDTDETEKEYTFDGNRTVEAIGSKTTHMNEILEMLKKISNNASDYQVKADIVAERMNAAFEANWKKISLIPLTYKDEVFKVISAMGNDESVQKEADERVNAKKEVAANNSKQEKQEDAKG